MVDISKHSSFILNAKTSSRYHWSGVGSLSFKYALQGESRYKLENRYLLCDNSNFIVLNQAQHYEIFVETKLTTETFCVFFAQPLVDDVCINVGNSHNNLVDKLPKPIQGLNFFERTHSITPPIFRMIARLKNVIEIGEQPELLKELLHSFLYQLTMGDREELNESQNLKFAKKTTRDEVFKRLVMAKDYAQSMYSQTVTLEQLAEVSCLSPNHLLRSFRQLFGISPIQYLNRIRFEKAQTLLRSSDLTVQEICRDVGYSSLGTFSNTFKKATGLAPSEFRAKR